MIPETIVMSNAFASWARSASVALIVTLNDPGLVAVPLITPAVDNVKPGGNVPDVIDHV